MKVNATTGREASNPDDPAKLCRQRHAAPTPGNENLERGKCLCGAIDPLEASRS